MFLTMAKLSEESLKKTYKTRTNSIFSKSPGEKQINST